MKCFKTDSVLYNSFVSAFTRKNNKGEFNMEKTVKLEQFKKLTEKELQEIQGGDWRFLDSIRELIFPKKK